MRVSSSHIWKDQEFTAIWKTFRVELIWRNIFSVGVKGQTPHSVVISEIYSHWKNNSSNHLFSNFFSKHVTFAKYLPKMRESKFPKLPYCETRCLKLITQLNCVRYVAPSILKINIWSCHDVFHFSTLCPLHFTIQM